MKFIADLHIHSKFSMATAKNLDLEHLYIAAQLKGIQVVATGDATHPGWIAEIKEKLVPAEKGLFKLKTDLAEKCDQQVPPACRGMVRFILESEISSIYKKNGRTRKNHNLVFLPDLDAADKFNSRLDKIGNIKSDGRPILGLDSRDLLEILLETTNDGFLIPAHIWTPWFSLFGSKSGFDAIEECFEDLSSNIFAVETGLSSDPLMNWRVKDLDGLTLVSNSDAHSPMKLGRESNLFNTDLSFAGIKTTLESGDPKSFLGTFEFYPEEGKYHLDGHRKCGICFKPHETIAADGICPVCGKPLTLGVLYRVEELAGRPAGEKPGHTHPFYSIAPLVNILSEIFRVGPQSKKIAKYYDSALARLGSEFSILHDLKIADIEKAGIPLLGEAVRRMRSKEMHVVPGYDGEYGVIKIFTDSEREELLGQKTLFSIPEVSKKEVSKKRAVKKIKLKKKVSPETLRKKKPAAVKKNRPEAVVDSPGSRVLEALNEEQEKAVLHKSGPMMIVAGPGTGKTRTITGRIAHIIKTEHVPPENILAVTFTVKAAGEMRDRLLLMSGNGSSLPLCSTLHSLCYLILDEQEKNSDICVIDDLDRSHIIRTAIRRVERRKGKISLHQNKIENIIISAKQKLLGPEDESALNKIIDENYVIEFVAIYKEYQRIMSLLSLYDYEDLILKTALLLENNRSALEKYRSRFQYIFVDEYQDLNYGQYRIIKALSPPKKDLCVIGDPDQSIYGFRGSDRKYFKDFVTDYPD
nr:UvrD-helicase domain-containing protein [Desulfobacterales bacterium]